MKNKMKSIKGITLISLVITIVVLLILASIGTYSGMNVVKSSKLTAFTTEMKIMQTQVNNLYQEYKNNETIEIDGNKTSILEIGENLKDVNAEVKRTSK